MDFACKTISLTEVFQCSLGLSKSECRLFTDLTAEEEALTTEEIADLLKLDRTTVQKHIKKLVQKGVVVRLQENLDKGGYIFRYKTKHKDVIRRMVKETVQQWCSRVSAELDTW